MKERVDDPGAGLDLDAIMARADAATPGPWCTGAKMPYRVYVLPTGDCPVNRVADCEENADGAFVAAARSDIPALVAECRRLRAEVSVRPTRAQIAQTIHDSIQREDPGVFVGPCYEQADAVLALFGAQRSEEQK